MKKTLIFLILTLTASIANSEIAKTETKTQKVEILTEAQIVSREIRSTREAPKNREIPASRILKTEVIKAITTVRLTRATREVRKSREVHYVQASNKRYLAILK